jgi:hypothetical protein
MAAQMAQITDSLGSSIDPGIFETVVALNLLGFPTVMSCEGHLDHGVGAPWIDIEPPGVEALRQAIRHRENGEAADTLREEVVHLRQEARAQQLHLRRQLLPYLEAFYQEHLAPFDRRLILLSSEWLGRTRLVSQGAEFQEITDPTERKHTLHIYQAEMRTFTMFLRRQFAEES